MDPNMELAVIHLLERHRRQPYTTGIAPIKMKDPKRTKEEAISWCDEYHRHMRQLLVRSRRRNSGDRPADTEDALNAKIDKLFELTTALGQQCRLYRKRTPKKESDTRPDHDAHHHLHHREWVFSRNIVKAFRLLPKKMQADVEMTFRPLDPLGDPPGTGYRGKGQARMLDMRRVLGIMLANPTQPARDVILSMTGAQANLVLSCADYSFTRLLDRMDVISMAAPVEIRTQGERGVWDLGVFSLALMNCRRLWRTWKPASIGRSFPHGTSVKQGRPNRNLGAWSDLRHGLLVRELGHAMTDEEGIKPRTEEICKKAHDFAAAGGTPHIDHLVNDIWDWVTAPDYAFSARPGDSLLTAMQLPESLHRHPMIKSLGPEDLGAVFGPAIGDLAAVLGYFQLALWVSTSMAAKP